MATTLTYEQAKAIPADDLWAYIVSGEVTVRVNMAGTRPTLEEAKAIPADDLLAMIASGKNADGTDFSGISAEIGESSGATAATGTITRIVDTSDSSVEFINYNETIRIQDGVGGDVTFTVINFAGGNTARVDANNCNLDLGGGSGDVGTTFITELAHAIRLMRTAGDLAVSFSIDNLTLKNNFGSYAPSNNNYLNLVQDNVGTAGNIAITATNETDKFTVSGMSGGTDA